MNYHLNLRHLRFLTSLEAQGHFGRAAAEQGVSQSTLSAGIRELEAAFGLGLVDRTTRRTAFTPAGLAIAEKARALLALADDLVESARASARPLAGPLKLGIIPTIGPFLLPRLLPELKRRFPELDPQVTEDLTAKLIEDLNLGRLDLAILALPYDTRGIETRELFSDPFAVAFPRGHRFAGARKLGAAEIGREKLLLLKDGHCLRDHALAACDLSDRKRNPGVEATSLHTLVQMADAGLGITLVPQLAVDAGLLKGTHLMLRPLNASHKARKIGIAFRKGSARTEEFEALGRAIRETVAG